MQKLAIRPQGIHVRQDHLASLGDQDDDEKKSGVEKMDPIEGLPAIGGDEPVETDSALPHVPSVHWRPQRPY